MVWRPTTGRSQARCSSNMRFSHQRPSCHDQTDPVNSRKLISGSKLVAKYLPCEPALVSMMSIELTSSNSSSTASLA
ncbi:Uncharacterised protein [Bordetella pertussis]|nr:Uncharacterised protein [Bordetella pertussis]